MIPANLKSFLTLPALLLIFGVALVPVEADAFRPAPLFQAADMAFKTLPSGVRTLVRVTPGSDVVSVQVWIKAGSRYEKSNEVGVSHLLESAADLSTQNFPSGDSDNGGPTGAIESLGGQTASLTSRDSTFYSADVAAPYFATTVHVLADMVLRPDLSSNAVEEARLRMGGQLIQRSLDGVAAATDAAYARAYAKSPYRFPDGGTLTSVAGLTAARVQAYHKSQYVGANITVVVVGDVSVAAAQSVVAKEFAASSSLKPTVVTVPAELPLHLQTVTRSGRVLRGGLVVAWRSAPISKPKEVVAMDTLLSLWREGPDASLRKILLRDGDKGPLKPLVGSFDVDFLTQKDAGIFAVSMADPIDSDAAVDAVLKEVRRIRDDGITPEELARAKEALRRQYIEQSTTVNGQAGALGFYDMISSYQFAVNYLDLASQVTAADIQQMALHYLKPDAYIRSQVTALAVPRPSNPAANIITAAYLLHHSPSATAQQVFSP